MTDFAMLKFSLVTDKSLMDLEVYGSPLTLLEPMATVPYTLFVIIIICRAIHAVTATG